MIRAKYICPDCKKETVTKFRVGKTPIVPKCSECQKDMTRQFGTISIGEVTSDEMIHLGQKMLFE